MKFSCYELEVSVELGLHKVHYLQCSGSVLEKFLWSFYFNNIKNLSYVVLLL